MKTGECNQSWNLPEAKFSLLGKELLAVGIDTSFLFLANTRLVIFPGPSAARCGHVSWQNTSRNGHVLFPDHSFEKSYPCSTRLDLNHSKAFSHQVPGAIRPSSYAMNVKIVTRIHFLKLLSLENSKIGCPRRWHGCMITGSWVPE